MILKIQRQIKNDEEKITRIFNEIYNGDYAKYDDKNITIGKDTIILEDFDLNDTHYKVLNAFLMNDEGKTIERIK